MHVKVKLYATLSHYAEDLPAGIPFEVEIKDGASLAVLLDQLNIPAGEVKVTFVNGIIQPLDYMPRSGDEVGIFPPIAGG
jgi:molybdopterin converting factor small subunit